MPTMPTMRHIFDELFASVGEALDNHVKLERADTLARHEWRGGARLELFADPARSEAAIADFAGGAAAARFRAFDARARMLFDAFDAPVIRAPAPGPLGVVAALAGHAVALTRAMAPLTTLWGVLGRSFHDPRLRQPFRRHATYVGGSPMLSPALLMLVWRSEAAGVWTVAGGIWRRGADLRCNARVARTMAEGGRASGVELADGTRIAADAVIFNGDPSALGAGLLGPEAMRAAKAVAPKHRSLSACVRAFSAEATGFALIRHTVFFGDDIFARHRPPRDPTVYVCLRPGPPQARRAATARPRAVRNHHERARRGRPHPPVGGGHRSMPARNIQPIGGDGPAAVVAVPTDDPAGVRSPASGDGGRALRAQSARGDGDVSAPDRAIKAAGSVSGGGRDASGAGGADGDPLRAARGRGDAAGPRFDGAVAPGGCAWLYLDAVSDDGARALTIIGFVGSAFSPCHAWAGRRAPENHRAIDMAVHGPGGRRSMTERGARSVRRDAATLEVGSSRMIWEDGALAVDTDEIAVPRLSRLRGKMRLTPDFVTDREAALSPEGGHVRRPFAPAARVEAEMASPRQSWSGHGYLDANFGNRPLEADCCRWTWSRARGAQGATVLYDAERRGGSALQLSGRFALGPVRAARGLERAAPPGRPPARRLLAHGARDALRRRIDAADRRRRSPPRWRMRRSMPAQVCCRACGARMSSGCTRRSTSTGATRAGAGPCCRSGCRGGAE